MPIYYSTSSWIHLFLGFSINGFFSGEGLQWWHSPIIWQHTVPYLWNRHGIVQYTTDEPYSPFSPLLEPPSDIIAYLSYPCYNTLPPLSSPSVDIKHELRKPLRLCSVGSIFFYKSWTCRVFLLVAPAFPSKPNHIFGTIYNTLMKLRTYTMHLTNNSGGKSVSRHAVSMSSYPQVTQTTIY